jgi:hypothetical protein
VRGGKFFSVKIVNSGTCGVNVDSQEERRGDVAIPQARDDDGEEGGANALGGVAEKWEEIRYLQRKSLHVGAGRGERGRNLKVAATRREAAE